jgi:PRTRC genetic system protein E
MNFFEQLAHAGAGNVDITMRIMQKNDKLTLNIMPGAGSVSITPIIVTGTPAELDAEFFQSIAPAVNEIAGIVTNLADVKKQVTEMKDKPAPVKQEGSSDKKKASAKKKIVKKEEPAKAVTEEPKLFGE